MSATGLMAGLTPVARRVRAYFAPVDRSTGTPTIFDPARDGGFAVEAPPAPWLDLGWCDGFVRKTETSVKALDAGAPATVQTQTRTGVGATVALAFQSWGKLPMALCSGSEHMNLLATAGSGSANGSGGAAAGAVEVDTGSTADALVMDADAVASFSAGDLVVVDVDYTGQMGFVGSGVSGAYVRSASDVGGQVDFVRRVSLNVGRVASIQGGVMTLDNPLLAGAPTPMMKVSRVLGFCDREGGRFFLEWSGLFCMEGEQGDRVLFHYPRLQTMRGAEETSEALTGGFERLRLQGVFRALPVVDPFDGARVVCFRSYLPKAD